MCYQSVVASALFYAVVCWRGSTKKRDAGRLDRLVRKDGSDVGTELECITLTSDKRTLSKLLSILDNDFRPVHSTIIEQDSMISSRLCTVPCTTERLRKSFVPRARPIGPSLQCVTEGRKRTDRLLCVVSIPPNHFNFHYPM